VVDVLGEEGVLTARGRTAIFVARSTQGRLRAPQPTVEAQPGLDLRPSRPERGPFPTSSWLAATRRAARRTVLSPTSPAGSADLRGELVSYLARSRGVETTADNIVVCAGFRTAITVLVVTLAARGASAIAIEDPTLPGIERAWQAAGLVVDDLPVDNDGADIDQLTDTADAVLLAPAHQFPLGGALAPARSNDRDLWMTSTAR
jgi:GntR family transcriptional regulator / MocR family aminotransferase